MYSDTQLNIKTQQLANEFYDNHHLNRYEPTSYEHLEQLHHVFPLQPHDTVVDFGCGLGRLSFYFHHRYHCGTFGLDFNTRLIEQANQNLTQYTKHHPTTSIHFTCLDATQYEPSCKDTIFYFFNPFSVHLFMSVYYNILTSFEQHPRLISIILYYPHPDYTLFLDYETSFELVHEIQLPQYQKDQRECFKVYQLAPLAY